MILPLQCAAATGRADCDQPGPALCFRVPPSTALPADGAASRTLNRDGIGLCLICAHASFKSYVAGRRVPQSAAVDRPASRRRGQPDAQPRQHRAMTDLRSRIVQIICRRPARAPSRRRRPPCQPTARPYRRFARPATDPVPSPARPNTGAGRIPIIKSMWTNAS